MRMIKTSARNVLPVNHQQCQRSEYIEESIPYGVEGNFKFHCFKF